MNTTHLTELMNAQIKAQDDFDNAVTLALEPYKVRVLAATTLEELEALKEELNSVTTMELRDHSLAYHCFCSTLVRKMMKLKGE